MTWKARALRIQHALLTQAWREEWPRAQLDAAIRDAYPWGPRKNHPYQAWLSARREVLAEFDNPRPPAPSPLPLPSDPRQLALEVS